jgi:N-acetylglucosamine-6-phosphate deacetylase
LTLTSSAPSAKTIVARNYRSGEWLELELRGKLIERVSSSARSSGQDDQDDWIAPAFCDIQVNGRWGHSFSSPDLTVEHVCAIVRAQASLGTARLCPTLITAPVDHMLHGLKTIAAACEHDPEVDRRVAGIHLEGPFLSAEDGYRGAHPVEAMRDPDWELFEAFHVASGRRIQIITIAPERTGAIAFIRRASARKFTVAIGHTAADGRVLHQAADAGAWMVTHLGNAVPYVLPRHPNSIWEQAALERLSASFIADGHHLDPATLKVLARSKGPASTILISDASPLAGLPPGQYGKWAVDPSGKIVVAGTPYLAGSNQGLETGVQNLIQATGWPLEQAIGAVTINPAHVLRRNLSLMTTHLKAGAPANLVLFRRDGASGFRLIDCCVDGAWNGGVPDSS